MDFNTGSIPIIDVKGIGLGYTKILNRFGIETTGDFLKRTQHPASRKKLSKKTGIEEKRIMKWASICDLIRIEGIAETWSELLIELGINSVQELASEDFTNMWNRIDRHEIRKGDMVKKKPTKEQVKKWLEDANNLQPILFFEEPSKQVQKVKEAAKEIEKPVITMISQPKEVKYRPDQISIAKPVVKPVPKENPNAVNHVGPFEKSVILISGIILLAMLIMYAAVILNPAWA